MSNLIARVPEVEILLDLQPEELGHIFLGIVGTQCGEGMFLPDSITSDAELYGAHQFDTSKRYPRSRQQEIAIAVGEAWHWLQLNMLMMPATDVNGQNGYKVLTRRGRALLRSPEGFRSYVSATVGRHLT